MIFRVIAGLLGLFNLANGLRMVTAPAQWFATAPGAAETGPFNVHFVTDVGFGFLAAGIAFLLAAWRPQWRMAALGASGFLVFHALYHFALLAHGHGQAWVAIAIAVPALLGAGLAWPRAERA